MKIVEIKPPSNEDVLNLLEEYITQAKNCEIRRIGIVCERLNGEWQTVFSRSDDCRVDGAMLIELGLRRLGFKTK